MSMIMIYYVHNLREGSTDRNWLEHWEKATHRKADGCHHVGCNAPATDGAHIQLDKGSNNWYIVPLCHKCNCQFGQHMSVAGPLVPVGNGLIHW